MFIEEYGHFVSIGRCVSELHDPIVMYDLRLFIVVLQELQFYLQVFIVTIIALHLVVSEIAKCIA